MKQPENLDEAVQILLDRVGEDAVMTVKDLTEREFMGTVHHFLGMSVRNSWELWYNEKPICKWFTSIGITHGDDRSGIILSALYCKMTNKEFDLTAHVHKCQEHWKAQGIKDGIPQIHERGPYGY